MHAAMQRLEGLMRKAVQAYGMIEENDAVCVGVSGGKDSVALAVGLARLARYHEKPYTVKALTLDPLFGGAATDYGPVTRVLEANGIEHRVVPTDIGRIVFDIRKEPNPCALCAKLRRGALHNGAKEMGCNRVALGHHLDDVVETFYMNLLRGGRIACFSPVTWLSRKELTLIRPLALASEAEVVRAVRAMDLPVIKSRCPVDGNTERASMKAFVHERCKSDPAFRQKTLGALQKAAVDGWGTSEYAGKQKGE